MSVSVTLALGTAAPLGSVTVPKMLPYTAWLDAVLDRKETRQNNTANSRALRFIVGLPQSVATALASPGLQLRPGIGFRHLRPKGAAVLKVSRNWGRDRSTIVSHDGTPHTDLLLSPLRLGSRRTGGLFT